MDDIFSINPTARRYGWLVAAAIIFIAPACTRSDPSDGAPLPAATLSALDTGKPADLETDGRPMVINFWASWCTPCRAEMPAFERVHQQLGDQVSIIGVTDEEDHDVATKAAEAAGVTYPLLMDEDQTLLTDLRVTGLPGTVFVDADGKVIGRHLGALTEKQLIAEIEDRYDITA